MSVLWCVGADVQHACRVPRCSFFFFVHAGSCLEYLRKRICRRLVCSEHAAYAQPVYILSLPPRLEPSCSETMSGRGYWK